MDSLSDFDNEFDRQQRRRGNEIFQPAPIKSLADIRRVLSTIDPSRRSTDSVAMETNITVDDDGVKSTHNVKLVADGQNRRAILLSGFDIIKRQQQIDRAATQSTLINGRQVVPAVIKNCCRVAIDQLIKRWLGGTRDGLFIVWCINGITYKYDIYAHKLFKAANG